MIPNDAKVVTVSQMQQLEKDADAGGHSFATMMEIAGRAVANEIMARCKTSDYPVLVLAGPGNNGGDGLVCAQHLLSAGVPVRVYLWKRSTDASRDYEGHLGKAADQNAEILHTDADHQLHVLGHWLTEADVVVDALLGTGNQRPITDRLSQILTLVGEAKTLQRFYLVAVDCPSGLFCDSGAVDPKTVAVDLTLTFGHGKWGHHIFPGVEFCGELRVVNIGIPAGLSADVRTFLITREWVSQFVPRRHADSHKGSFGKAMAVVGSRSFPGAAYLSCAAAGRVGAGLVTGAIPRTIWPITAAKLAEPTWLALSDSSDGQIREEAVGEVATAVKSYGALLLGCGLGQTRETEAFVRGLLQREDLPPTLVDADGLNILAKLEDWPRYLPPKSVLTPHPAEMGRLCATSVKDVIENRWQLARKKAKAWNAVVLVKGPYTVIAAPDERLAILPVATPALATAGTGDVLAGSITGLLAQGVEPFNAACVGAWLHGKAGQRCEREIGSAGVIASDLLTRIPVELASLSTSA